MLDDEEGLESEPESLVASSSATVPFRPTLRSHVTGLSEAKGLSFCHGSRHLLKTVTTDFRGF